MRTLKSLVIICIILGLGQESIKAQVPQKTNYQPTSGNSSTLIGNWNNIYGQENTLGLYRLTGRVPVWVIIIEKPVFTLIDSSRNYLNLISKPTLLDGNWTSLKEKPAKPVSGITDNSNNKLAILNGLPDFTTSELHRHSTITNKPTLFNNGLYRAAGTIYKFKMETKYPILSFPKK
jgi:hypothetical protein